MRKNKVYIHVAKMNNWQPILTELLEDFRISGLDSNAEITLVSVGGPVSISGVRCVDVDKNITAFEFPTLHLLQEEAEDETNILYCHLKGVSQPYSLGHRAWRRDLCEFNIIDWTSRISHLKARHTSGARITNGGCGNGPDYVPAFRHYSGNFWWSRGEYIKQLPNLETFRAIYPNRYAAEAWIGQSQNINEYVV